MAKLVDIELLGNFKKKQDAANSQKFLLKSEFVEKADEIIKMHVDSSDPENIKYFADNNGVKSSTEITGEVGKIYIDVASGGKFIYTYGGENFIPFVSEIATAADIENLFE